MDPGCVKLWIWACENESQIFSNLLTAALASVILEALHEDLTKEA